MNALVKIIMKPVNNPKDITVSVNEDQPATLILGEIDFYGEKMETGISFFLYIMVTLFF